MYQTVCPLFYNISLFHTDYIGIQLLFDKLQVTIIDIRLLVLGLNTINTLDICLRHIRNS